MEAALSFPISRARVEVRGDTVEIDSLTVEDRTLAEVLRRRAESGVAAEDTASQALEIGARVLDREATAAEVDFVKREFERASGEVERAFTEKARTVADHMQKQFEKFLGEESGAVPRVLDQHAKGLEELIAQNFGADRSSAVQHQLREAVAKLLQDSRADLLKQFSAQDGHNPLADFKGAVVREMQTSRGEQKALVEKLAAIETQITRLRDAEESRAELDAERERGTAKGRTFEAQAFDLIEQMAAGRGDVAHHVGDERSATGGKNGDVVVEIDAAQHECKGRIAFEIKDSKLSKNEAWTVLNGARADRDAAFAILVVGSDEKVPSGRESLQEYGGDKMIVALDKDELDPRPLELAYRYARCRVLMALERDLKLDAAGVRDAADEAMSALKDAQKIRIALTGATGSVQSAREALDAMVARVQKALDRVEGLIASSE